MSIWIFQITTPVLSKKSRSTTRKKSRPRTRKIQTPSGLVHSREKKNRVSDFPTSGNGWADRPIQQFVHLREKMDPSKIKNQTSHITSS
jgi:hypothetical protein